MRLAISQPVLILRFLLPRLPDSPAHCDLLSVFQPSAPSRWCFPRCHLQHVPQIQRPGSLRRSSFRGRLRRHELGY
jgi:hypothetical protein